jgi:hypothetical protein
VGQRRGISPWLVAQGLVLAVGACTAANPAYRGVHGNRDAGADDAAAVPDEGLREPADVSPPDLPRKDGEPAPLDAGALDRPNVSEPVPSPPDSASPPTAGLVASWPFAKPPSGTTITDETGGNTAQLHDVTWSSESAPGMPPGSQSMDFDGKTSYVDLTFAALPRSEGAKTIAIWYRSTTAMPTLRTLVSLFGSAEILNLGIQLGFSGTQLACWRFGAAGAEATAASTLDAWHHGAYTFAGNVHRLYVDGKPLATFTGAMKPGALDRARLGTYDPPNELFKGQVNDFRVYDRALDDTEIAALAGRP